jgi:GABA(A) receptor-associated protein
MDEEGLLSFKQENSFEKRKNISGNVRADYPDRVPVIVERYGNVKFLPKTGHRKFLVPLDISTTLFVAEIRKKIKIEHETAIWFFVGSKNSLLPSGQPMFQIYNKYADEDGFLYMIYSEENSFGRG